MLDGIKAFVKGVINRMFPAKNVEQALKIETCISSMMQTRIELWQRMYSGMAPWCKGYVKSLRKEQGICTEFANICLDEMESNISVEELDQIYKMATRDLNENLQSGLALGAMIIKPLGGDKVEYVTADRFVPIAYDERHSLRDNILTITNNAYISKSEDDIGREIPLSSIDEWKNLPATISYAGLEKPDFGYYRNPIKNEIDRSPCGVSIFESGIDQLESVDVQNARLKWEFESGERAINVSTTALQPIVGEEGRLETPKLDKRLYRGLNLDAGDDGDLYKEWSPEFRDISIINGLNQFLRQLEFNVSLSYGDLSDVTDVDKTATEAKIAKKRKYNMVSAIQENLKDCLEDLVYALAFYNAKLHSGYEFNCTFKDSILVDDETERQNDRADVSLGAMQLWEYRMKHYAEDEETAKKMVVQQADVIED